MQVHTCVLHTFIWYLECLSEKVFENVECLQYGKLLEEYQYK